MDFEKLSHYLRNQFELRKKFPQSKQRCRILIYNLILWNSKNSEYYRKDLAVKFSLAKLLKLFVYRNVITNSSWRYSYNACFSHLPELLRSEEPSSESEFRNLSKFICTLFLGVFRFLCHKSHVPCHVPALLFRHPSVLIPDEPSKCCTCSAHSRSQCT